MTVDHPDELGRSEFFDLAMQPGFQNRMNFEIERVRRDKDLAFSLQALENLTDQMRAFVGARILAKWNATGIAPQELHVEVKVSFETKRNLSTEGPPWFKIDDKQEGITAADGESRLRQIGRTNDG